MLRIIAGEFRSRKLLSPQGEDKTRPMPDRVRVALFNMLQGHYADGGFCDVFAGTGSFGLEAVSRGCPNVVCIEKDREVAGILARNVESLGAGDRCRVVQADALAPAALAACPRPAHVVFFDPPYPLIRDPEQRRRVFAQFARFVALLDERGFAILRTPWPLNDLVEDTKALQRAASRRGHAPPTAPPPAPDARPTRPKDRPPEGDEWNGDDENWDEPDDESADQSGAPRRRVPVDLGIEGARGPETHVYGSMALHWYMRA
ncbi:MAG: RsmD family RNA methyltransferase [Phycisphaerales bacterium]|nr:RsmD family RNA methyltransferase [Phycisphaerales bacterium]